MTITLDENLVAFVAAQAALDGVTAEVWVERKANAAIRRVQKNLLISAIESAKPDEVERYAIPVITVKDEIQAEAIAAKEAYLLEHPIVEVEAPIEEPK